MRTTYYIALGLMAAGMLGSCKKKLDFTYDNRVNQQPIVNSSIRLVNLVGATQLSVGGQRLTNYLAPDKEGYYSPEQSKGTIYFPENGRMGTTFNIPRQLLSPDGWADSIIFGSLSIRDYAPPARPFRAKDDESNPHDYYFVRFSPNSNGLRDSLFKVPKGISPAADPGSFRIRLLNLASETGSTVPGIFHKGPMTVTYADGTPVRGLENIAPGAWSDYIDLPYGTNQFKVLDSYGKEVPASNSINNLLSPITGTLMDAFNGVTGVGNYKDTWLTYAPLKTFQPGGVYTLVVAMSYDSYVPTGNPNGEAVKWEANTFRILSDIAEPVNMTYARLQTVNVIPGSELTWQIDGRAAGTGLAYTKQSDYQLLVTGKHTVKVTNKQGAVLVEKEYAFMPGDNYTAWIYTKKDGSSDITFCANNLSGRYYNGTNGDDGSYSLLRDIYPFWIRFMNFATGMDEVTFTANNGQLFSGGNNGAGNASQHILFAQPVTTVNPYVIMGTNFSTSLSAYASKPGVTPGNWMQQVTPLKSTDFIARPALYKTPLLPQSEPGIYTVALVGNTAANAPENEKARMIIVKHNK